MKEEIFYECARHCQEQAGQFFFFKAEREKDKEGWYKLGKKTYRQSERCSYGNKWLQGEETSGLDTERV